MKEATDYMVLPVFKNEPYIDPKDPDIQKKMNSALEKVVNENRDYDIIIGGRKYKTERKIKSINPSNPSRVLATFSKADRNLVDEAIEVASKTFESWKLTPPEERVKYFLKAAAIMREKRFELDATMILESGKSWIEADADLAEAIDFLEYYSREMLRYASPQPVVQVKGEVNELKYIPLGVGAVIPPWNFPGAIMAGMTTAASVTGNTVVLKPASDSPLIAAKFVEILHEAGLPAGVVNFLPGSGGEMGDYLVEHPRIRFISFTGSKEVGLGINEKAAKHQPGQKWIKRVILEMGGKDCVVVDETADIDMAAKAAVTSAFGFQGQKCSAGSRIIAVKEIYDELLEKMIKETKKITVGDVSNPGNWLGPVINEGAMKKILSYIEIGSKEGRVVTGGKRLEGSDGYFIEPTIIADVDRNAVVAQEEIFGPVTALIKAEDFEDAMSVANGTEYGLTGALITGVRERIERAKDLFHVGNLYFNRKCTGALVGVQPFGGFNMSGTDSKAGGRDYLLLFMQGKSITERINL